jgi:hypothetical protein
VIYTPCPRRPMTQRYPCGRLFVPPCGSEFGNMHPARAVSRLHTSQAVLVLRGSPFVTRCLQESATPTKRQNVRRSETVLQPKRARCLEGPAYTRRSSALTVAEPTSLCLGGYRSVRGPATGNALGCSAYSRHSGFAAALLRIRPRGDPCGRCCSKFNPS